MPAKRTQNAFKIKTLNTYFPELWENVPNPKSAYLVSDSFWYKKVILYTLKGSDIKNLEDLFGKHVGAVRGYSYGEELLNEKRINIQYHHNDDLNLKMLLSGRIDAIIGDNKSTLTAVNNNPNARNVEYDLDKPITVLDVFYVCHNTKKGIKLCDNISKIIRQLKNEKIIQLDRLTGNSKINL